MNARINTFIKYLQVECGFANNTVSAYSTDVRSFIIFLNGASATIELVRRYIASMNGRLDVLSIKRKVAAIKLFLKFTGHETIVPMIDPIRGKSTLPKAVNTLTADNLCGLNQFKLRDKALIELLYATGMRISELLELRWQDVNITSHSIRVFGKGSKERRVFVNKLALATLLEYRDNGNFAPNHYLFPGTVAGSHLTRQQAFNIVKDNGKRLGVAGRISPHTLRHTFATQMVSGGADLRTVQELMGHSCVTTTQKYISVDTARLKQIHSLLPR